MTHISAMETLASVTLANRWWRARDLRPGQDRLYLKRPDADQSDPRIAASRARLTQVNRARPEYAVTQDNLPMGAAAAVVWGGRECLRLIVADHERLTDDVLHVARLALAFDEMGVLQPGGMSPDNDYRVIPVLSGDTILLPVRGDEWRPFSMVTLTPPFAARMLTRPRSRRLLRATRGSPYELIAGILLRRARRGLFW